MTPAASPTLVASALRATIPAYAFPAASAWLNAQVIGSEALADAAPTTIAIPSALAALVVTARDHARPRPERRAWPAAMGGATLCLVLAAIVCAVAVGNGLASGSIVAYAVPSAAIGGAIAAASAARRSQEQRRNEQRPTGSNHNPSPIPKTNTDTDVDAPSMEARNA